jgi:polar amino acid transport system substrate-binding protein
MIRRALIVCATVALFFVVGIGIRPTVHANEPQAQTPGAVVPNFWDLRRRSERPDMTRVPQIRFITDDDFPPFNFAGPDGQPSGFNIDLARAICEELRVSCTLQARRWDTLLDALDRNQADAVIASLAVSPELRRRYDLSDPYLETPARFVRRTDTALTEATPEALTGRSIAVAGGTAHEAYLRQFFPQARIVRVASPAEMRNAIRDRQVDVGFGDGIGLAFWLGGSSADGCCVFLGGPFTESRFFGEGLTIVMRRGNDPLRLAINHALVRLAETGRFAELYLKAFPIGPY